MKFVQICLIFALIGCTLAQNDLEKREEKKELKRPEDFDSTVDKVKKLPGANKVGVRKIDAIGKFLNAYKNDLFNLYTNKTKINTIKFHPRQIEKIEKVLSDMRKDLPLLNSEAKKIVEDPTSTQVDTIEDLKSKISPEAKRLMSTVYLHLVDLNIYGVPYRVTIPTAIRAYRRVDRNLFKIIAKAFDIDL